MPDAIADRQHVVDRYNVTVSGPVDGRPLVLAHGFGCDQNMWRRIVPSLETTHHVVVFDHVGSGPNAAAYDPDRYGSLDAYAEDLVELCEGLDLRDVVVVGHSVSAMVGVLAAKAAPDRITALVLVSPSPRYIDDDGYVGGFTAEDIDDLLRSLEANYLGWSSQMAPMIMGAANGAELGDELTRSFCATDPTIARQFAEVTFTSDNRADLAEVRVPTLVLQCTDDAIAPVAVGEYVSRMIPDARLALLDATGHCPHLSAPEATVAAIRAFLD